MALFRAAESTAARFMCLAVSMSLFSAHAGEVLVMNSRMSLSLGNAFSRKPGSRARGGLKAGRPTDGRQAGRSQAFEPGCEASGAQQRCHESRDSAARPKRTPGDVSPQYRAETPIGLPELFLRVCGYPLSRFLLPRTSVRRQKGKRHTLRMNMNNAEIQRI